MRPAHGAGAGRRVVVEPDAGPMSTARSRPGERGVEIKRLPDAPELVAPDAGRRGHHEEDRWWRHNEDGLPVTVYGVLLEPDDNTYNLLNRAKDAHTSINKWIAEFIMYLCLSFLLP